MKDNTDEIDAPQLHHFIKSKPLISEGFFLSSTPNITDDMSNDMSNMQENCIDS